MGEIKQISNQYVLLTTTRRVLLPLHHPTLILEDEPRGGQTHPPPTHMRGVGGCSFRKLATFFEKFLKMWNNRRGGVGVTGSKKIQKALVLRAK